MAHLVILPRKRENETRYRMLPNDTRLRLLETSDEFTVTAERTPMVDSCGQPESTELGTSRRGLASCAAFHWNSLRRKNSVTANTVHAFATPPAMRYEFVEYEAWRYFSQTLMKYVSKETFLLTKKSIHSLKRDRRKFQEESFKDWRTWWCNATKRWFPLFGTG